VVWAVYVGEERENGWFVKGVGFWDMWGCMVYNKNRNG